MHKKDYEAIAKGIRRKVDYIRKNKYEQELKYTDSDMGTAYDITRCIVEELQKDNKKFDLIKFLKACGF